MFNLEPRQRTRGHRDLEVTNKAGSAPELFIYDDIGPEWAGMIDDNTVKRALDSIGNVKEIVVRINSPGGDVFAGLSIYNLLRRNRATIHVEIDSLAASIASLIAMAGDTIRIAQNAMIMIHNSWTIAAGNKAELQKTVNLLGQIDGNLADAYLERTYGLHTRKEIVALLDAETWMTADQAFEAGFVDAVGGALNIAASVQPGRYRNTPAALLRWDESGPDSVLRRVAAHRQKYGPAPSRLEEVDRKLAELKARHPDFCTAG